MCAPCKVILDEALAAAFDADGSQFCAAAAGMALAISRQVDEFKPGQQNAMSQIDYKALARLQRGEDAESVARWWFGQTVDVLESKAGFLFGGPHEDDDTVPMP